MITHLYSTLDLLVSGIGNLQNIRYCVHCCTLSLSVMFNRTRFLSCKTISTLICLRVVRKRFSYCSNTFPPPNVESLMFPFYVWISKGGSEIQFRECSLPSFKGFLTLGVKSGHKSNDPDHPCSHVYLVYSCLTYAGLNLGAF